MIRRVSPWDSARRFASCDLYPVYSSYPSRPPPGISRDVCGYLTRENNLRGYIVLTRSEHRVGREDDVFFAVNGDRTNIEIALERLSWDERREKNGWQSGRNGKNSRLSCVHIENTRFLFYDFVFFLFYLADGYSRNNWRRLCETVRLPLAIIFILSFYSWPFQVNDN